MSSVVISSIHALPGRKGNKNNSVSNFDGQWTAFGRRKLLPSPHWGRDGVRGIRIAFMLNSIWRIAHLCGSIDAPQISAKLFGLL
jgi:hypothetical protein